MNCLSFMSIYVWAISLYMQLWKACMHNVGSHMLDKEKVQRTDYLLDFLCRKQIPCGFNIEIFCAQQNLPVILLTLWGCEVRGGKKSEEISIPKGVRFLTVSVVFMGKPGQTSSEFTFQKSQPISRVAAHRNRWQGCPRACKALHAPADVSPRAACLCAGVGARLRQPAGRGEEGSSAPEAGVHQSMPSCKGQMGFFASAQVQLGNQTWAGY